MRLPDDCSPIFKTLLISAMAELEVVVGSVRIASSAAGVTSAESQRGLATPIGSVE
jgi:hypothetical protein